MADIVIIVLFVVVGVPLLITFVVYCFLQCRSDECVSNFVVVIDNGPNVNSDQVLALIRLCCYKWVAN